MRRAIAIGLGAIGLLACSEGPADQLADTGPQNTTATTDPQSPGRTSEAPCLGTAWEGTPVCAGWRLSDGTSRNVKDESGLELPTDVTSVTLETRGSASFIRVRATGVPSYELTLTEAQHNVLTSRPFAETDFRDGSPTVSPGDRVFFGMDIGYNNPNCALGFWPPGPQCPGDANHDALIPVSPEPATEICYTSLDTMGLWLNGASLFNWWDGASYNGDGEWNLVAAVAEAYDLDLCGGHAAGVNYHHHAYSPCLAEQVGDEGLSHSPVYGFAADGYPIHGPWHAKDAAAESCWKLRDYEQADSPTGCGGSGERTCLLVNPLDVSEGTTVAPTVGPTTRAVYESLSQNLIPTAAGLFYEDYYYDPACTDSSSNALDASNGHDHDGLGYHYHVTFEFPHTLGPFFHGKLPEEGVARCAQTPARAAMMAGPPR